MLKEKTVTKITKEDSEAAFFNVHAAQPVNLFLTRMFHKTSFMTWRNYMLKMLQRHRWEQEVERERQECELEGKPFTEPVFREIEA